MNLGRLHPSRQPAVARATERALQHAARLYAEAVPPGVVATDADAVRAAIERFAPAARDAVEEALFHSGAAAFAARVRRIRASIDR